ncbi:DUF305 domain-containing protein [Arthrobacter sp. Br18]|uniref:DUF305 domain-containing protein n=1 Tax=Arthrobacter sp. Br18 TaxID=1312954 RepID=UPI0004798F13|nr:DUF305 domain-containing protein [Arthrobacter sp. Br18]
MRRYHSFSALGLAAVLTLAGCGTDGEAATATASRAAADTSESPVPTDTRADAAASTEHNDADAMFAQMMIPHHQQAVEMGDLMLAKDNISPEITDLATQIKQAQGPEIGTMTGWLEAWDEPMEPDGGMEGHSMGDMGDMEGMMSDDRMAELEAADGDEASRIFLESMTAHHEGAVEMAQTEIDNGRNTEALDMAEIIAETQQAEIQEMEALLAEL